MKTVKELRNENLLDEAYILGHKLYKDAIESKDQFKIKSSFIQLGYVYYDLLKKNINNIEEFVKYFNEFMTIDFNEFDDYSIQLYDLVFRKLKQYIFELKNLNESQVVCNSNKILEIFISKENFSWIHFIEHKNNLFESLFYSLRNTKSIIDLSKWFKENDFNDKNSQSKIDANGKKLMSLKEMYITNIGKVTVQEFNQIIDSDRLHVIDFLEKTNHSIYIYAPYYLSKIYLIKNENEKARLFLIKLIKKKAKEFWVWSLLAETFDNKEDKITCLIKSVTLPAPEEMKINVRLKLALVFAEFNLFAESKFELLKYIEALKNNDYKIKNNAISLQKSKWFEETPILVNNNKVYEKYSKHINNLIYSDIKPINILVYYVNFEKSIVNYIDDNNLNGFFVFDNNIGKINIGDVLNVRFIEKFQTKISKVVSISIENDPMSYSNFYSEFKGIINIHEKGFAFIENIYFSSKIINSYNLKSNQNISFKARKTFDFKTKKIKFELVENSIKIINIDTLIL